MDDLVTFVFEGLVVEVARGTETLDSPGDV